MKLTCVCMHPMNIQKHTVLAKSGEARSVIIVCDVSHISCDVALLVSGSAAFVVLGTRYICAPAFSALHTDIHPNENDGCDGFYGVTVLLLSEFGYICYQDTYPMYRACILHVFCMYLDVPRSYIKIHQDTSRYICIFHSGYHRKCILLVKD